MATDGVKHPSWSEIDAVRSGEGSSEDLEHLRTCAFCQAQLNRLKDLATALGSVPSPPIDVPADIEARILWSARKQARGARRSAPRRRRLLTGTQWAVAAAVVLTLGAVGLWRRAGIAPVQIASVTDIDGNGRVDIRDAFVLAKAIDRQQTDPAWDSDGDSDIDLDDVDRIARIAVAVGKKG